MNDGEHADIPACAWQRRELLGGSALMLLSGCVDGATWRPGSKLGRAPGPGNGRLIADAHAHLFNAADLPIGGFLRYVILPELLPELPKVWEALGDLGDHVLKGLAISASKETPASAAVTDTRYAAAVTERVLASAGPTISRSMVAGSDDLQSSYKALALVLASRSDVAAHLFASRGEPSPPVPTEALRAPVFRTVLGAAKGDVDPEPDAMGALSAQLQLSEALARCADPRRPSGDSPWRAIINTLRWGYLMVQPRHRHLRAYLEAIRPHPGRNGLAVNLLVDFDRWLGSSPKPGSDQLAQIDFWSQMEASGAPIRTFAGYDPLRHAEERLSGGPVLFDTLKRRCMTDAAGRRSICGFKLYPPMGFRAAGNVPPAADRAGTAVLARWRSDPVLSKRDIGRELDASLDEFFGFCADAGIPVLAHTYDSNRAFCGSGQGADPRFWRMRLGDPRYKRTRVCFGHFGKPQAFIAAVDAVREGKTPDPAVWPFGDMAVLFQLSAAGEADVYADTGYMDELLPNSGGDALARCFFEALAWWCGRYDPDCKRLMFGSDWIMLARETRPELYVDSFERAMAADPFWTESRRRRFFGSNLRRFLGETSEDS